MDRKIRIFGFAVVALTLVVATSAPAAEQKLVNASYDLSREFYKNFNEAFAAEWKKQTGDDLTVEQTHAGSSKQARAVIDGLEADVVTLNQTGDVDALVKAGLVAADWKKRFPYDSSAYRSITSFIVRKGNPKNIKTWDDLVRDDVQIALVNPKTGGNGRYTFLAAYGHALKKFGGDQDKAKAFVTKLYKNVPVLDTGGRAATTTFAQRGIGDVLVTFEAETYLVKKEFGVDQFEAVIPPISISSTFPFAIVDTVADKHGTRKVAEAYLRFLSSPVGQEIAARNFYRPNAPEVAARHAAEFPTVELIDVDRTFGGWTKAQETFFADGGVFDQIYTGAR